jgi:hypothetical protein
VSGFGVHPQQLREDRRSFRLDQDGSVAIALRDWFGAVNGSLDCQLCAEGAPMPMLHVAGEIEASTSIIIAGRAERALHRSL